MIWLVISGDGVMMAATSKIITKAYLAYFFKKPAEMRPIFASTNASMGNSKAMPQPRIKLVRLSI